ncbi:hypothetical protein M6B22_07130 [Jatrophihabitans cynanchi]|uniref:Uncharacterized protein n=1 Tax=Jatrophihabitans cynanchi TaxID=2944128 RepID=A0ABY7K5C0_9ACTN|nr:hypothetical protein [Jatrophihabitans sp. SB3-54]WAX58529.1 hypothetical protein M6B22_07130 [Jatrophihabitans sp. SB3-54]
MTIPAEARRRLAAPVRAELERKSWAFPAVSTVPLPAGVWNTYVRQLREAGAAVHHAVQDVDLTRPFNGIRRQLEKIVEVRSTAIWRLMAMCAFEPFNAADASSALERMDTAVAAVLAVVENEQPAQSIAGTARIEFEQPEKPTGQEEHDSLSRVFGLSTRPVDETGEFSASRVFEAFKYDVTSLVRQVLPHVASLGVEPVDDVLALVCICGWIADAPDPVLAYSSMHEMLWALDHSRREAPTDRAAAFAYLHGRDEALRQTWRRVIATLQDLRSEADSETRAHQLADVYKRITEGPFRQYAWTMRCLSRRQWSVPPTLGPLQAAIASDGDWLASVLDVAVLRDVRNGQAHESLVWDGHREVFIVDDAEFTPRQVVHAFSGAVSFVRGCEAAFAHDRAGERDPGLLTPTCDEPGRLQPWRRAEAFFGTNGLRLRRLVFNSRVAEAHVEQLDTENINPCLQALVLASRLLPRVETFRVWRDGTEHPVVEVGTAALRLVDVHWERALNTFTAMPLSTFLPANLDARKRHESESVAARSVAWIAADDVLDAIDGADDPWTPDMRRLACARIAHARACLHGCAELTSALTRIKAICAQLEQLEEILGRADGPGSFNDVDALDATQLIRHMWQTWGPVPRLPTISERSRGLNDRLDCRAQLQPDDFKDEQHRKRWRSI